MSEKPRLLDLFCGAGGCTKGYRRAGFYVVGVDIDPQPNYCGDEFVQMDALEFLRRVSSPSGWRHVLDDIVGAHASPPCQNDTAYNRRPEHVAPVPELIGPTRELLIESGLPYVVENVPGAPLRNPITLCGSNFGLDVRRHRLFETSFPIMAPPCNHAAQQGDYPQATNRSNRRKTAEIGVWRIPLEDQKRAMGVDWDVTLPELSQMIPPAYTEHIGHYLLTHLAAQKAAA